jgi:hypothetical protein
VSRDLTDKQLDILNDHYKETFARLKEGEAARDRLFLWLIGLFALLSLEIGYPAATGGSLGKLTVLGAEVNLQALPLPALLTATWVLTLTIGLRYCQKSLWVDRQYPYLHTLEDAISPAVGGGDLYRREGKVYLRGYPPLLNIAWFAYVVLFPLIVAIGTAGLLRRELAQLAYPWLLRTLDVVVAASLIVVFLLYRVQPYLAARWRKWRDRGSQAGGVHANSTTSSNEPVEEKKL